MTRIEAARAAGYADGVAASILYKLLKHAKGRPLTAAEEASGLAAMKDLALTEIGRREYATKDMPVGASRFRMMISGK